MCGVRRTMRKRVCLNDFLAVAAVLIIAGATFLAPIFTNRSADYVKITTNNGEELVSLDKNSEYAFNSNDYSITVKVENREVFVVQSSCPDKVCINSGKISRGGEIIICAPAFVSIEIIGESGDVDYAVG